VIVECAWCSCVVGQKDGLGATGVTSGICDECFAAIYADISAAEGDGAPGPGCVEDRHPLPPLSLGPEPRDASAACAPPAIGPAASRSTRSRP
jgi:hypothetical protein